MPIRLNSSTSTPMRIRQERVPHLHRHRVPVKVGYFVSTVFYSFLWLLLLFPASHAQAQTKRPMSFPEKRAMTFQDMMQMRRLGDTDVSPDGKWLLYSVTDVDLAKNTRTPSLWIQPVSPDQGGGEPKLVEGAQPGDGGARFSHDGKQIL